MSAPTDITGVHAVEFDHDQSFMLLALVESGADPVNGPFLMLHMPTSVASVLATRVLEEIRKAERSAS